MPDKILQVIREHLTIWRQDRLDEISGRGERLDESEIAPSLAAISPDEVPQVVNRLVVVLELDLKQGSLSA